MRNYIVIDRCVYGYFRIKGQFGEMEETPWLLCDGFTEKESIKRWRMTYGARGKHLTIIRIY